MNFTRRVPNISFITTIPFTPQLVIYLFYSVNIVDLHLFCKYLCDWLLDVSSPMGIS